MLNVLSGIVGSDNVIADEPMSRHTSFRIGGPCDYFVLPHTTEEIQKLVSFCKESDIPYFILGNGSNLLVNDTGFRGIVISIGENYSSASVSGNTIQAKAGTKLTALSNLACKHALTGLEFAAGIPGTVGGGIIMNAGAYGGEISQVLTSAVFMDADGQIFERRVNELELAYRSSLPAKKAWIVLEALFMLSQGSSEDISALMKNLNARRREKQPLEFPSAGSTFKRPEGYFAGKLISDCGLSGKSIGDACVSPKHNGFIINTGRAKASDVLELIEYIKKCVYTKFHVELTPEVKFLGFESADE